LLCSPPADPQGIWALATLAALLSGDWLNAREVLAASGTRRGIGVAAAREGVNQRGHSERARRCQADRGLFWTCRAADADDHLARGGALCLEGCGQVGQFEDRRDRRAQPLAADQRGQFA
jgi:hypothetical protein